MNKLVIKNASVVNEGNIFKADVIVVGNSIESIFYHTDKSTLTHDYSGYEIIDATGKYLFPGVIDDHVHFREPGLTYKADMHTESMAAVAGGVTSIMEMPNTNPNATSIHVLEQKFDLAAEYCLTNFSFYLGVSKDNLSEIIKVNPSNICGIKLFMGSSTGYMMVNDSYSLEKTFAESPTIIAAHCEDEKIIQQNLLRLQKTISRELIAAHHPEIRSEEACYRSTATAIEYAQKYNSRLHILHLSTAKEVSLFENKYHLSQKKITSEACTHHLWFDNRDYAKLGNKIKCNPAIKSKEDKNNLRQGLLNNKIDVVATDHAPHTLEEKEKPYINAPSGIPLIQHSLVAMLELYHQGVFTLEMIVDKMCHAAALLYNIEKRGFIKENYFADLVLVDLNAPWLVNKQNILYKCAWSPYESSVFRSKVITTIINGKIVYNNGNVVENSKGKRLIFRSR